MEKLGIQLPSLITQIINFLILVVLLTKFLYKPILKNLDERKKKIAEGLAWTEKAKREEEKLKEEHAQMVKTARNEAKAIIDGAKKEGAALKEEMIGEGKKEVAELKRKLEKDMEGKFLLMSKELTGKTVDIAYQMVKQVLADTLTQDDQHQMIKKQLQKIKGRYETK